MREVTNVAKPNSVWLEQLIRSCEGAARRLQRRDDPAVEPLLKDLRALQARLQQQLEDLGR